MRQFAEWLERLGLSQYAQRFAENDIDFTILGDLTDQDLEKIGIVSLGHRRKLLRAIADLEGVHRGAHAEAISPAARLLLNTAERRHLTVMLCDLVGSTSLSTRLDPEDMRAVIDAYHAACARITRSYDGFLAEFRGDGILAYFGYPLAHEDDAERAIRGGLALIEAVGKLTSASRCKCASVSARASSWSAIS